MAQDDLDFRIKVLTIGVSYLAIVTFFWAIPTVFGLKISGWILFIIAILGAIALWAFLRLKPNSPLRVYRYITRTALRGYFLLRGSSKRNFGADALRLIGTIGLILSASQFYRRNGDLTTPYRVVFLGSVICVLYHAVIHPLIRPRPWEIDYDERKLLLASALNNAAACVEGTATHNRIVNIELNALSAIKSYLEFTVFDTQRSNFGVNLIVKDPGQTERLICIQRAVRSSGRDVPTYYAADTMKAARKALETGEVYYNGRYSREEKDYQMVWLIPLPSPDRSENTNLDLVAIDSRRRRHLDLRDDRKALLRNLSPYLAALGLSLSLRRAYNIWDELP